MPTKLTAKQQALLAYLQGEIQRTGSAPSLRRAALNLGVSHAAVAQGLKALEKKGYLKRNGRYSRNIYLLNRARETGAVHRWQEIPIVGRVTAGLPMYAQQEWEGSLVLDSGVYPGGNLFALRIRGDSMVGVGMFEGDLVICEPRQYARNREIVVALVHHEEATVKRFFLHEDTLELRPENPAYPSLRYGFGEVLIQGRVIGVHRGPEVMERL